MKHIYLIFAILLLAGCAQQQDVVKIGLSGPLTGEVSSLGEAVVAAAEIAVEEINAAGGINGKPLEIIFEDDQCTSKGGITAGNKLINIDNVPVIIGPLCSTSTLAMAPLAEEKQKVVMAYGSSNPGITDAGDFIFRDYPSDAFQGKVQAEYVFNELELTNAAVLLCLNDWCQGISKVFTETFENLGGTVVVQESFEPNSRDIRGQLIKIKEASPEILMFYGFPESSTVGIKQAKELEIDIPIIGGDIWSDQTIWDSLGELGDKVMYTKAYSELTEEFVNSMAAKGAFANIGAPQAYDAIHIVADIMNKVGTDSVAIKNELYKVQGYEGVSGSISFDENGDLASATYELIEIVNGEPTQKAII